MILVGEEDEVRALVPRVTAAVLPAGQVVRDASVECQVGALVAGVWLQAVCRMEDYLDACCCCFTLQFSA